MTLGELKQYVESLPAGSEFMRGLSDPFSWRGSYDEVAFAIEDTYCTREEILEKVEQALTKEFYGWKGGTYRYSNDTPINFEHEQRAWSNGDYTENWIDKLMEREPRKSPEERLIKLLFKN